MADKSQYDHEDKLLDHEYDGIQEYDNPLPTWWKNIFWVTIIFSVLYAINIGPVGSGPGWLALYEQDVAEAKARFPQAPGQATPEQLAQLARDPKVVALGKETYERNCAACHRADGGGLIGPNLTDAYWLHGGRPEQVLRTVQEGVLAKGMPAWSKVLKPDQVSAVVAYIGTLKGSAVKDGKAPEGTPESAAAGAADGTPPAPAAAGAGA